MSKYILRHDEANCIGCEACELHCKTNKGLGPGALPCKIVSVGPVQVGGRPRMRYVFMPCFHCEEAWCAKACPTESIKFGPIRELRQRATARVAQLQKLGRTSAYLYGEDETMLGGLNSFYLLVDRPEVYERLRGIMAPAAPR